MASKLTLKIPSSTAQPVELAVQNAWLEENDETGNLEPRISDDSISEALDVWRAADAFNRNMAVGTDAIAVTRKAGSLSIWLFERPMHENGWSIEIFTTLGVSWEYTIFDTSKEVSG